MSDVEKRKKAILRRIKKLRNNQSEAFQLLGEKATELEGLAPAIELVPEMSDGAWRNLPSAMKEAFQKYRR